MEEKNRIELQDQDKILRDILSATKIEAGDNLKFRIMQQIETEKALSRRKSRSSFSVIRSMLSVFGTMYAIIAIIAGGLYTIYGKESLESSYIYWMAILVTFVCIMFWLFSVFDEKRRSGKHNKSN